MQGALQRRRDLLPATPTVGYECTIPVPDVDAVAVAVVGGGGKILMEKTTFAAVGHLVFFADLSGNVAGAMQYDPAAE